MRQLMEERVLDKEGSHLASTAYIYNGLETLDLKYAGRQWRIPYDEITEIPVLQVTENDEMTQSRIKYFIEGEIVARELVEKHDWDKAGIKVFLKRHKQTDADGAEHEVGLDHDQIERLKEECKELGRLYKLGKIEEFRKGRENARAGQAGYRLHPIEKEIHWMRELGIRDDIFNPANLGNDVRQQAMEAAIAAVKPFADMMERILLQLGSPEKKGPTGPRRRSINGKLEPIEDWQKRRDDWQKNMDAVAAAEAEASDVVET